MDPRYDPYGAHGRAAWAPQPGGPPPGTGSTDDALIRLGGWVLGALATVLLAAVALLAAAAVYGLATSRRWRWWVLLLAGVAGGLLVLAASGPQAALERHLLAARELTAPGRPAIGELAAARWVSWVLAQLPLGLPIGAMLAGFARHQVCHVVAHELSPRARRRREREDGAQLAMALRRAAAAPAKVRGGPVLGAWVGGDLATWKGGPWCVLPEQALGLGTLLLGLPGSGKTETLLRLSQLAMCQGYDVHVIDAKGDAATQARFASLSASLGVDPRLFPQQPYDGFRGDGDGLRNRLGRVIDFVEPYYQDGTRVLLAAACGRRPPRSMDALLARLETAGDVDTTIRRGALYRYRSFAAAVGEGLDGAWAFEDTRASYILLDGVALGDDAPRLARFLVEDFAHYAAARKDPQRGALLLVDEFSALRLDNAAALFERLRSFGVGVVLSAQSLEGLHDDDNERDRLLNAASTVIAHRLANPDGVVSRAGTLQRAERSHQLDGAGPTGAGSLRIQDAYRADPNEIRSLATGVAYVISSGRAAKVAVAQARGGQAPLVGSPRRDGGLVEVGSGPGNPVMCHRVRDAADAAGEGSGDSPTGNPDEDEVSARVASPYAEGL